jgi:carbonic anhydrase
MKQLVAGSLVLAVAGLTGCATSNQADRDQTKELPISQSQQAELTPDQVLADLMDGNERYVNGGLSDPNIGPRIEAGFEGQYPQAIILSCVDSRVPVEMVFDQGLGDIFVGRVAGNIATTEQIGSMEFATKVAGSKLVMVLGHEACGAVKGATDDVEMGNLTELLDQIKPAIDAVEGYPEGQRNSKNKAFVDEVIHTNVELTVEDIRERSEVLSQLEEEGKIKIVGALYSLQDGSVRLID